MITYLLNFFLCSGLLLLVYRVFLQNENLYKFNRFYLLFSLIFSMVIPFVNIQTPEILPRLEKQVITTAISKITPTEPINQPIKNAINSVEVANPVVAQTAATSVPVKVIRPVLAQTEVVHIYNYLPQVLITLYLLAAFILLLRFARNGYHIGRTVAKNPVIDYDDTKLVLLNEKVAPHSFLKYVFINKKEYSDGTIEPEIICHEQTHVRQLHSLDIILVELLQIVCWFNPIIFFYRKAIQLNHEFLADEAVIKSYHNTTAYQCLLLNKASQYGGLSLTSPFNYLNTKKRLIMMTKTTSAKIALYKQFAIVPVLACAILLFCHKVIAQTKQAMQKTVAASEAKSNRLEMIERPIAISIAEADTKIIPPAKSDAPKSIIDEYAAILTKYDLSNIASDNSNLRRNLIFSKTDRLRLQDLFNQMSKKQQNVQQIQFGPLLLPVPKRTPDAQQFTEWRTKKRFRLYIDGKSVDRAELAKYKPTDFDCYQLGVTAYNSPDYGKYKFEIDLMTPAFYVKDYKQTIEDRFQIPELKGYSNVRFPTPDYLYTTQIIPPAKHDAPQSVLDEYAAILKKHNLPPDTSKMHGQIGITFITSDADRLRLQDLFNQMSKAQQSKQQIQYGKLEVPSPKRSPSNIQLANWQNTKKFRVWIDDKVIDQKELAKYKAEDFDGWAIYHLSETTNPNYKHYQHEVHLMTKAGYISYYKQTEKDRRQMPVWTVMNERFNKHKTE